MITQFLRVARIAAILWIGITAAHAQGQKSFVRDDLGERKCPPSAEPEVRIGCHAGAKSAAQLRREGQSWLPQGLPRQAINFFAAAIALEPANFSNWSSFAAAALAINPGNDWQERYKLAEAAGDRGLYRLPARLEPQ